MILSYKYTGDAYDFGRTGQNECGCDDFEGRGAQTGSGECGRNWDCDEHLVLAIATVPMQKWRLTYSPEKALCAGTMFAELNLPFKGGKCR